MAGRQIRQTVPMPGPKYNQALTAQIVEAINRYMFQETGQGEIIAGRFIMTDQPTTTEGLAVGTLYLKNIPGYGLVLSVVQPGDP